MTWRSILPVVLAGCCVPLAVCPAAKAAHENEAPAKAAAVKEVPIDQPAQPSVRYLPLDGPAGTSQAVVLQGLPLVYTRQLLPLDRDGKLVGEGSADEQIEQVLANLEAVLDAAGSGLDKLVRLNVCALSHQTAELLRERLAERLRPGVRPAMTVVLTPLGHRKALVAVDAVAVGAAKGDAVALRRVDAVAGDNQCADYAVMPPGGVAYLSGQPAKGGLAMSAVAESLSALLDRLGQLKLSPAEVVQVKVFLRPASSAEAALSEVKRLFSGQLAPPVVFVEWIASAPVEIELVAHLPASPGGPGQQAEPVEYYNPPEMKPSPSFSRAALVRSDRQIYISGLCARAAGDGQSEVRDVFDQLEKILSETGSDLRHLAKATYYVSEDDASRWLDKLRPEFYDPARPPAASKVMVHGVARPGRTFTMDIIAVGSRP